MNRLLMLLTIMILGIAGCTPKNDTDVKTDIVTRLKAAPDMSGVTVDVAEGIVTIEGECKDDAVKANCEKIAQEVKGVKTVINNIIVPGAAVADTVVHAVTAPVADSSATVAEAPEDPMAVAVADVVKKYPGVTAVALNGVITLTGEIKQNELAGLTRALNALKPKKIVQQLRFTKNVRNVRVVRNSRNVKKAKPAGRKHSASRRKTRRR